MLTVVRDRAKSGEPWKAVATICLYPSEQGGRVTSTPADWFGCVMQIDGVNLDIRLNLDRVGSLSPGQSVRVPIGFLDPNHAEQFCEVGKDFGLWEGREIGNGVIVETSFAADRDQRISA